MFRFMLIAILGSCFFLVDCLPCKAVKEEPKKEEPESNDVKKEDGPKKEEEKKEAVEVKEVTVSAPAAAESVPTDTQGEKKE